MIDTPPRRLADIGVVVTRPARQAATFAQKLAVLGAVPILVPSIVIVAPADRSAIEEAHAHLDDYDIAVFVSANAVEHGMPSHDRWPARLVTLAPGPGTAEALTHRGLHNARVPSTTFDSEGLLALPELQHVEGKRVLVFCGEAGRNVLATSLRDRKARVDVVVCYRRTAPTTGAAGLTEAITQRRAHAITLTSVEGTENLWTMLDDAGRNAVMMLQAFAPHPRIAAHARSLGFNAIETPGGDAGLIAGLLEWARSRASN
ncbi:MAG TPA: uroporphyrinogen-III synthase [Casimicrobiaceae bacterium]|nr:uroporphyrinogen-III synthase [Casimicrobiaceae bacterium]